MGHPRSKSSHDNAGYTIPGFAREFGLDEGTVRRSVEAGDLKTVKFGGLRRIPPAEADRFRQTFRPEEVAMEEVAFPSGNGSTAEEFDPMAPTP